MNKRKHQLERIVRYEYDCFKTLCYPKDKSLILLSHISKLLEFKIRYLYDRNTFTSNEQHFMLLCNYLYYNYYVKYINNIH